MFIMFICFQLFALISSIINSCVSSIIPRAPNTFNCDGQYAQGSVLQNGYCGKCSRGGPGTDQASCITYQVTRAYLAGKGQQSKQLFTCDGLHMSTRYCCSMPATTPTYLSIDRLRMPFVCKDRPT